VGNILALWFGSTRPVDRPSYAATGFALMMWIGTQAGAWGRPPR